MEKKAPVFTISAADEKASPVSAEKPLRIGTTLALLSGLYIRDDDGDWWTHKWVVPLGEFVVTTWRLCRNQPHSNQRERCSKLNINEALMRYGGYGRGACMVQVSEMPADPFNGPYAMDEGKPFDWTPSQLQQFCTQ